MGFPEEIRRIRQRCLLTQTEFSAEVHVAFSTVNRWEAGRSKPNINAMKNIKAFCLKNGLEFSILEEAWLDYKVEENKNG